MPASCKPVPGHGAPVEVLLPLPMEVPRSSIRGVAHPVYVLVHRQAVGIELTTEVFVTRPQIEVDLQAILDIPIELLQLAASDLAHLHAVNGVPQLRWSPLKSVRMELVADVEMRHVHCLLVALWTRHAIHQVHLHLARALARGTDLLKVQLVPKHVAPLGAFLPQEEGADHAISWCVANARLELPVSLRDPSSQLG